MGGSRVCYKIFTTFVTKKKLLQKTRSNKRRPGFAGFRYPLITVELPAIPQQRFAPFQSLPQKKVWQLLRRSIAACELTKIAFAIFPFGSCVHFPTVLISTSGLHAKKKSGSYCGAAQLLANLLKLLSQFSPSGRAFTFPPF